MKRFFTFLTCMLVMALAGAQTVSLNEAISNSVKKIEEKLEKGTKIVVLNFQSDSEKLSKYVIEELVFSLVESGKLTVIERTDIQMVQAELKFQFSGDVSDESAQSIGKILGAKVILSGSFDSSYRFRLKAIAVESAQLLAVSSFTVGKTGTIEQFIGGSAPKAPIVQSFSNPGAWNSYNDQYSGGDSVISFKTGTESIKGTSYMVVTATGKVTDTYKYGYIGMYALPDTDTLEMLKNAKGIKFKIIGDGNTYRVVVETSDIKSADRNYYGMDITPKKGDVVEVIVPYSIMKQSSWGKTAPFNPDKIVQIGFSPLGTPLKSVSFKLFDVLAYE